MDPVLRQFAREVIETESTAVRAMGDAIDDDFERAVHLILTCPAAVLTTGIGKAGHVARKVSANVSPAKASAGNGDGRAATGRKPAKQPRRPVRAR